MVCGLDSILRDKLRIAFCSLLAHSFIYVFISLLNGKKICLSMQEMQETRVQSLGQENPLEEEMATHSSVLAWKIQWTEEPGGL